MKKFFTILTAVLITATACLPTQVKAQSPEKMTYQAVIRNASDQLVTNQGIGMQISILQGSATGTDVYAETHNTTTNANGLVTVEIGNGTIVSGDFSAIDWANDVYFIKTETDPTTAGGTNYTITGTSQLLSVPYALHSKTTESFTEIDPIFTGSEAVNITSSDITNLSNLSGINTGDQQISRTDLTVTLSNGGTYQDSVNVYTAGTGIDITNNVISTTGATPLAIGDSYGGGIIFWLDASGQHGLIAATNDQSTGIQWWNGSYITTGAILDAVYAGKANIELIISVQGAGSYAAQLCDDYSVTINNEHYGDWYLPSKYELNLLYLQKDVVGGFTINVYWSSTENGNVNAWSQNFNNGSQYNWLKSDVGYVRAVRAF